MNTYHKCCGVIFTKDRPLQLYSLLETWYTFVAGASDVYVLLKASNERYRKQYRKVKFKFRDAIFVEERSFHQDLVRILCNPLYSHVLFSVDDNLFVHNISLDHVMMALDNNPEAIGFSLRLGHNIKYCHTLNKKQALKTYRDGGVNKDTMMWSWIDEEFDFGYPLEVSSSVYRTSLIKTLCQNLHYNNPNSFEHAMELHKPKLAGKFPYLLSFTSSRAVCLPMNITQTEGMTRHSSNQEYTIEKLLQKFESGQKMNWHDVLDNITITSPHTEYEFGYSQRR